MRLTKITILALRGLSKEKKQIVADKTGCSLNTLYRLINENEMNGDLTKASALKIIAEVTGLEDSQILEEDAVNEVSEKLR